jgi:hypothetical protein
VKKGAPKGIRRFLKVFDVVGGSNLRGIMTSLPFVGFLVLLGFLHIANNHQAESYARRMTKTEKEDARPEMAIHGDLQ